MQDSSGVATKLLQPDKYKKLPWREGGTRDMLAKWLNGLYTTAGTTAEQIAHTFARQASHHFKHWNSQKQKEFPETTKRAKETIAVALLLGEDVGGTAALNALVQEVKTQLKEAPEGVLTKLTEETRSFVNNAVKELKEEIVRVDAKATKALKVATDAKEKATEAKSEAAGAKHAAEEFKEEMKEIKQSVEDTERKRRKTSADNKELRQMIGKNAADISQQSEQLKESDRLAEEEFIRIKTKHNAVQQSLIALKDKYMAHEKATNKRNDDNEMRIGMLQSQMVDTNEALDDAGKDFNEIEAHIEELFESKAEVLARLEAEKAEKAEMLAQLTAAHEALKAETVRATAAEEKEKARAMAAEAVTNNDLESVRSATEVEAQAQRDRAELAEKAAKAQAEELASLKAQLEAQKTAEKARAEKAEKAEAELKALKEEREIDRKRIDAQDDATMTLKSDFQETASKLRMLTDAHTDLGNATKSVHATVRELVKAKGQMRSRIGRLADAISKLQTFRTSTASAITTLGQRIDLSDLDVQSTARVTATMHSQLECTIAAEAALIRAQLVTIKEELDNQKAFEETSELTSGEEAEMEGFLEEAARLAGL